MDYRKVQFTSSTPMSDTDHIPALDEQRINIGPNRKIRRYAKSHKISETQTMKNSMELKQRR